MVTGWTRWQWSNETISFLTVQDGIEYKGESEYPYIDFAEAIDACRKRMPSIITLAEMETLSKEEDAKKLREAKQKEWDEYDKNPWLDGKKEEGENLIALRQKCYQDLVDYCVKNRIYISPNQHQNEDWGVPVFDNKYVDQFSLRSWGGIMAEVWNKIMGREDLNYLDFYCNDADKIIKDYKKPLEIVND